MDLITDENNLRFCGGRTRPSRGAVAEFSPGGRCNFTVAWATSSSCCLYASVANRDPRWTS